MISTVTYSIVVYNSIYRIPSYWNDYAGMYFKAGCYCQVNADPTSKYDGSGECKVSFYSISKPIETTTPPLPLPSKKPTTIPSKKKPTAIPSKKKPTATTSRNPR